MADVQKLLRANSETKMPATLSTCRVNEIEFNEWRMVREPVSFIAAMPSVDTLSQFSEDQFGIMEKRLSTHSSGISEQKFVVRLNDHLFWVNDPTLDDAILRTVFHNDARTDDQWIVSNRVAVESHRGDGTLVLCRYSAVDEEVDRHRLHPLGDVQLRRKLCSMPNLAKFISVVPLLDPSEIEAGRRFSKYESCTVFNG